MTDARCEALFASALQPSDAPTPDMVAEAITCTVQRIGMVGCVDLMAQEFGDHPDGAVVRMRWARQLTAQCGRPATDSMTLWHRPSPGRRPSRAQSAGGRT